MSLIKANNLPSHYRSVNSVFDDLFKRAWVDFAGTDNFISHPAVNIKENDDKFELELAVPGLSKEQVNIHLDEGVLTISATTEQKEEVTESGYKRREFNYNSFKRSFHLPDTIDSASIGASYENGILLVNLPKREEAKKKPARNIAIG